MTTKAAARGRVFGLAAESYERFRPGYPDEVVDRTLAHADREVRRALEVGAGTGKATRAFASRGVQVTALEPDADMYAVLTRETAGMPVDPVPATFEDHAGPPADLLYAASAWHWTDPLQRWTRTAELLASGGVLALFEAPMVVADPELRALVDDVRDVAEDESFRPLARRTDAGSWPVAELRGSDLFCDVLDLSVRRELVLPQREYVGYLSTTSACLMLPLTERRELLRQVAKVLPAQVRLDLTVPLVLARRA